MFGGCFEGDLIFGAGFGGFEFLFVGGFVVCGFG